MFHTIRKLIRFIFHGSCRTKCNYPSCTRPDCAVKALREKIAKSENKVLKLHIDRYADYQTRTRVNEVKRLFEKEGVKVVIITR